MAHGAAVAVAVIARSRELEIRDGDEMATEGVGVAPRNTWLGASGQGQA